MAEEKGIVLIILLLILGISFLASMLVVAALMLSSRLGRPEYDEERYDKPVTGQADRYQSRESA